jgi:CheY-like chemotaxis protein
MRLLWVENHVMFARIAGQQFLSAHSVSVVPSLADAQRILKEQIFDAVLLDYDLDDGKGASLVTFVQQLPDRPVVIATSSHEAGNEALLEAGANAVCSKTRFREIESVIAKAIGNRSGA